MPHVSLATMLFSSAAEALTTSLAFVPILYKINQYLSSSVLPLALATSVGISSALVLLVSPRRAPQSEITDSPHEWTEPATLVTAESHESQITFCNSTLPSSSHVTSEEHHQENGGNPSATIDRRCRVTTGGEISSDVAIVFGGGQKLCEDACIDGYRPAALTPISEVKSTETCGRNELLASEFSDHKNSNRHSHVLEGLPAAIDQAKTVAGVIGPRPEASQGIDRVVDLPRRQCKMDYQVPGDEPTAINRPDVPEQASGHGWPNVDMNPNVVVVGGKGRVRSSVGAVAVHMGVRSTAKASQTVAKLNGSSTAPNGIQNKNKSENNIEGELVGSKMRRPSPAFDGLIVGVAIVPMVLSSLFLLCKLKCAAPVPGDGKYVTTGQEFWEPNGCSDGKENTSDEAGWVEYFETMLEGSVLCTVWEVMFAVQRALRGEGRGRVSILSRVLLSSPSRLAVLVAGCVWYCRRPLLPLWCLVMFDSIRRTLAFGDGDAMRRLSLRPGEASILAHALALWATDACFYTHQKIWLLDPRAWGRQYPRVPCRSGGMVVVQTGVIGTLLTGLAMVGARQVMPTAWASDARRHFLSYAVLVGGTVAWLSKWTAPLLGSNPVTWAVLYALGVPPEWARAGIFGKAPESSTVWRSFAGEWLSWAKSALLRYRYAWSSSTTALETCNGVVLGWGIDQNRPLLVACWLVVLAVMVPLTPWMSRRLSLTKTTSRKIFHAQATVMFVPAISTEPGFLSLALGAALGILLALEFLRCTGCPPVARSLDKFYGDFLDARDGGCVIVTHLFLLLGCSVPVWLSGLAGKSAGVLPYAGVIVLGVGDSMGAVIGSRVGRLHWPGSRRTLEGSLAVFSSSLAMLAFVSFFVDDGTVGVDNYELFRVVASLAWPVTLASLMEAFTTQVDNLVLPCVLFSCLTLRDV